MKRYYLILLLFVASSSYGQQLKIVGKPVSSAFDFAGIIAQTMKLNAPDSAHTKSNKQKLQTELKAADDAAKWIVIDFNKDSDNNIESVSISGPIPDIIELYATLYDSRVRKVKPKDVFMGVEKDGELRKVRTDFKSVYDDKQGVFGRIFIIKN